MALLFILNSSSLCHQLLLATQLGQPLPSEDETDEDFVPGEGSATSDDDSGNEWEYKADKSVRVNRREVLISPRRGFGCSCLQRFDDCCRCGS
jgi:hypothetical protein